jgi:hypothetical protein
VRHLRNEPASDHLGYPSLVVEVDRRLVERIADRPVDDRVARAGEAGARTIARHEGRLNAIDGEAFGP